MSLEVVEEGQPPVLDVMDLPVSGGMPRSVGSAANPLHGLESEAEGQEAASPVPAPGFCARCLTRPISGLRSDVLCGVCVTQVDRAGRLQTRFKEWQAKREHYRAQLEKKWKVEAAPGRFPGQLGAHELGFCLLCKEPATEVVSVQSVGYAAPVEGDYGLREDCFGSCAKHSAAILRQLETLQAGYGFRVEKSRGTDPKHPSTPFYTASLSLEID